MCSLYCVGLCVLPMCIGLEKGKKKAYCIFEVTLSFFCKAKKSKDERNAYGWDAARFGPCSRSRPTPSVRHGVLGSTFFLPLPTHRTTPRE